MPEKHRCLKCGREFEPAGTTGRPPSYCSVGCRRAAAYQLQRLQRHLTRLEEQRLELAGTHPLDIPDHRGRTLDQAREDVDRAIAELEARLAAPLEAAALGSAHER